MRRPTLFVLAGVIVACSGGNTGTNPPPPAPPPPPPPASVASITVTLAPGAVVVGTGSQAVAVLKDASGNTLTGRPVAWSSGNPAVATISSSGAITTVTPGTATITATAEGVVGTAQLTVNPRPVATVTVALGSPTLVPGATTAAIATTLDAFGNTLTGRSVTWSSGNPAIATVASNGQVTAVAPGTTSISATSEGIVGSAQLTVTQPPVATVAIIGSSRVKVGDQYQYTVEARLADGTLVQRPVSWSLLDPTSGTITQTGLFTPLKTGTIGIRAVVESITFDGAVTGYDWAFVAGTGIVGASLPADVQITNKFGTSEYPELTFVCSNGSFLAWVDTEFFVTASGLVTYSFDGGTFFNQMWIEFDSFSALGHPGPTNLATKTFAAAVAISNTFGFAFTEFQGSAKATIFRVTGLSTVLPQILAACPSDALREDAGSLTDGTFGGLLEPTPMDAFRQLRLELGPEQTSDPSPGLRGLSSPQGMLKPYP